jgi:hypothetical protein
MGVAISLRRRKGYVAPVALGLLEQLLACALRTLNVAARDARSTANERTWRWRLLSSTSSWSAMPSLPTPAAARYSSAGEPSPPAPTTSTAAWLIRSWPAAPSCTAPRRLRGFVFLSAARAAECRHPTGRERMRSRPPCRHFKKQILLLRWLCFRGGTANPWTAGATGRAEGAWQMNGGVSGASPTAGLAPTVRRPELGPAYPARRWRCV